MTLLEALHQTLQAYRMASILAVQKDDPTVACLWVTIMNNCLPQEYRVALRPKPLSRGMTEERWKGEMWAWYAEHLEAIENQGATYIQEKLASFAH